MNKPHTLLTVRRYTVARSILAFGTCAVLAVSAIAQIASGTTGIDATGNAASEMAACKNGKSQQSRETCMTEVRNANAAKAAGKVGNSGGQYKANALMRCNTFKDEDKLACEARVTGSGTPSGSVAGGGVITQVERVVAPATPAAVMTEPKSASDTPMVIPAPK